MSSQLSIFECDDIIRTIESKASEESGEITPEDMQALVVAQTTSMEKLGKLVNYISFLDQFNETAKAEIDRIRERQRIAKNRMESIKQYLLPYVQEKGRVTVGTHSLSVRKSKGVVLEDGFNNPQYCECVEEWKPDKKKIKESIESGIEVKGAVMEERINLSIK